MTTIEFSNHDGVALLGDLTIPDGPGPFPALVGVHGGGWQQGSRDIYKHWGHYWMGTNPADPATGAGLFAPRLLRFLEDML